MRSPRALLSSSIAVLAVALPCVAGAEPTYPGVLQTDLGLSFVPLCTTCHVGVPGPTTSVQPFSVKMQASGFVAGDASTIAGALMQMEMATPPVDSDMNGTSDIDQLKAGCNPNDDTPEDAKFKCGGGATDVAPVTSYGCGAQPPTTAPTPAAQLAPGLAPWQGAALLAALGAALARRARRAQRHR